ncbi:MAG: hypothetical protein ACM31C_00685 [Acidobacteriota bacterium]
MKWALLAAVLAACNGTSGTLAVSLATAPGSTVLDSADTLELILTNPHRVTTAHRGSGGFSIELDLPATNTTSSLIVDAFDASGALVATGASPAFPLGAIDAKVVIYMAAPDSIAAAPIALAPARSDVGTGTLAYGALFAGGRDASGAASDAVAIYNTYDHSLVAGMALPAARAGLVVGIGANDIAYLFGGSDASGAATDTLWRFDTNIAPNGAYVDYGDKAGFARADQLALPLGSDTFLVTGAPPAELSGLDGSLAPRSELAALPAAGATVLGTDGTVTTILAGAAGIVRFRTDMFDTLAAADQTGAAVTALPGGRVLVACGAGGGVVVDAATGGMQPVAIPMTPRTGCALAATSRHLLVVGGATAELYDATSLAYSMTIPLVAARTSARAVPLPNDQILIASGVDASGAPVDTLELFTPEPVE